MSLHTPIGNDEGRAHGPLGLREQAVRILAAASDGLDDASLARSLFGAAAGARWDALLATVLGGEARVERVDGRWRLIRGTMWADPRAPTRAGTVDHQLLTAAPDALVQDGPILTLALATTGADPRRHRIVHVAVIRHEAGAVTARLDESIGIGERLPGYLRAATRIGPDEAHDAEPFQQVVPTLRELLDGHTIHVYGARRAAAFLEAELRRAELPRLDVTFVEIDGLIRALLPRTRKPGLRAAADELGIQASDRASPLAEADLAARVVARLRERQGASPSRPTMTSAPESPASSDEPLPFTRAWLATVPSGPGVYCVEDAAGTTLYVGKAIDLQRRLAAYVGRQPSQHRRFEALGVRAAAVRTCGTPSDLEATLLEARLIREHLPEFNVARRTRGPRTFVRAASDERSPRVSLVDEPAADGARYFGPFESARAARQALDVARAAYPAAFARRRSDVAAQRRAVVEVCRLLAGQKAPTLDLLRTTMSAAAERGDRAEIDRLRAALRDVQALDMRPSLLTGLAPGWRLLVLERLYSWSCGRLHLIHDGRLTASADTDTSVLPANPERLERLVRDVFGLQAGEANEDEADPIDRPAPWLAEDSVVLMRWLAQASARLETALLPRPSPVAPSIILPGRPRADSRRDPEGGRCG